MKKTKVKYQFFAKLNSSILIATLPALATPTEHTNPFELGLFHLTFYLHLALYVALFFLALYLISSHKHTRASTHTVLG